MLSYYRTKIEPDSRPQASQLFQQRSMATRVQPWHHLCYQPNCRVLQQDCDGTSTTLPTSTHWSASECSYHCANRTFPATIQPEEGKLGAVCISARCGRGEHPCHSRMLWPVRERPTKSRQNEHPSWVQKELCPRPDTRVHWTDRRIPREIRRRSLRR